jgi:tetratricopeptide (TPR) repeat protein
MAAERELVGRGAELAAFDRALDALERGRAVAVLLSGEPGIGKSRLLAELGARADARGMLVLDGSASEFEQDLPFWLFVDALDEYLLAVEPARLHGLDDEDRAELAHILPSWTPPAADVPGREDQRYRTHRAVRRVLEVLAAPAPVVLLLDDLHWADSGSVELLCALLRRPPVAPVLVGLALRPRQAAERLTGGLDRARAAGLVTSLQLCGLDLADARRLVGPDVDAHLVSELHAESGGNPLYLRELARSGRATRTVAAAPDNGLPAAVARGVADELTFLSAQSRRVLAAAAVVGDPFPLEMAAAATALPEAVVAAALDDLRRRDLVRPADAPRRFRFRHPLLRRAVYDAAPRAWRVGAHERCAEALAARGTPPAGRAHHVIQAASKGDLGAVALLRTAGDAVVGRAPAEAARWYQAAIDLLPDAAQAEAGDLWSALAGALGAAGQLTAARTAEIRAIDLLPDEAVAARVRLVAECVRIEHALGHHDAAHRRLLAALDRPPRTDPAEAAALLNAIALDDLYHLEYDAGREWSRRAHAAAGAVDDVLTVADAATGLALSAAFSGAADQAGSLCTEAAGLVDGLADERIGGSPDPIAVRLAAVELFVDRYADAERHAERGLAAARALGSGHQLPVLFWTGTVRAALGRLPAAATLLDEAVEVGRSAGNTSMLGWVLLARSAVATAGGDVDLALAAAEESVEAHPDPRSLPAVWSRLALAAALLDAGWPARAEHLLTTAAGERMRLLPHPLRPAALELLTRCLLALDHARAADRAAEAAGTLAVRSGLAGARATADRAAAAVALHRRDPRRAADLAVAAAATAESIRAAVDAATARELAGHALARAGSLELAADELRRSADGFERCGAPQRRAAVERELGRLGQRGPYRRTRPGIGAVGDAAALTERELQGRHRRRS